MERGWLLKAASSMGLDLDADPNTISADIRDGIVDGIRSHYIATEPSRKYRRREDRTLLLVTDGTTFDTEVTAQTAMVPTESIKWMKKSDRPLYDELRALKVRLDTRSRVRYASLFTINKEVKKAAQQEAAGSGDKDLRDRVKASKKAEKAEKAAKPMTLETIAGMCEAMFTGLEASVKAKTLTKEKADAVGATVALLLKATGIQTK